MISRLVKLGYVTEAGVLNIEMFVTYVAKTSGQLSAPKRLGQGSATF
jgi:hypothetical protein